MIIPIRCFSCGKPVGHHWEEFVQAKERGVDTKKNLDSLNLDRFCCRALFVGHLELIDTAGEFRKA